MSDDFLISSPSFRNLANLSTSSVCFATCFHNIKTSILMNSGYGLSVEARKRVTIGVELAAKPELLLFLDEPTRSAECYL